jgi:hypothetical protein
MRLVVSVRAVRVDRRFAPGPSNQARRFDQCSDGVCPIDLAFQPKPAIVPDTLQSREPWAEVYMPRAGLISVAIGELDEPNDVAGPINARGDVCLFDVHVEEVSYDFDPRAANDPTDGGGIFQGLQEMGLKAVQRLDKQRNAEPFGNHGNSSELVDENFPLELDE